MNNLYTNISADAENAKMSASNSVELIDRIEAYLEGKYDFRFNEVTSRVEFKPKTNAMFRIIRDKDENTIWGELQKAKLNCPISYLRQILLSDFVPLYDPFKEYLTNLAPWDGKTNYIQELANTVKTTNQVFWEKYFTKWIVAMVAALLEPKLVNHTVLVFVGGQGVGKTTWIERLVPDDLKDYLFSGTIDVNNKDTLSFLSECMLINLDELENLGKSDLGTLKSIITQGQIKVRKAYCRNAETSVRRASFAGSINNRQFLSDSTGERRFLTFDVEDIVLDNQVQIAQVLSQALSLYRQGFSYWLSKEENDEVTRNNSQFQKVTLEEELLLKVYQLADQNDPEGFYLTTTEILYGFNDQYKMLDLNGSLRRFGQALTKHSFLRRKNGGVYKYWLKKRHETQAVELKVA